jgi:hypothetical protein
MERGEGRPMHAVFDELEAELAEELENLDEPDPIH